MFRSPRRRRAVLLSCSALALLATGCAGSTAEPSAQSVDVSASVESSAAPDTSTPSTSSSVPSSSSSTSAAASSSAATAASTTTAAASSTPPAPAPTAGTTAIVVDSTPQQYFVLFVKGDPAGAAPEVPVSITRGQAGSTTLTDGRRALSDDHYRVATFSVDAPGDVDGDGVDDLTELADPAANPLNPAPTMGIDKGAVSIPDVATYQELSYQGNNVGRDSYLAGLEVMKFIVAGVDGAHPSVYFMNTNNYNAHPPFASMMGIPGFRGPGPSPSIMRGDIVYEPDRVAPDGTKGVYRFAFQPSDAFSFAQIALAYEVLTTNMPFLEGKLAYYAFPNSAYPLYQKEKATYDAYGRIAVIKGA